MTTTDQALTVDCPECGQRSGQMCVTISSETGREAKRTHNGRNAAFFWSVLPPAIDVPEEEITWVSALGPFSISSDRRYRIRAVLADRFSRTWIYEAHRRDGDEWTLIGSRIGQYQVGQYRAIAEVEALVAADRGCTDGRS